ncbi:hypothetical protein [Marinobacter sp. JSM 1782161]|uniref:hypothetical protein n=1 Tax=Marinobacter sp. JSM 1782161 TaxID=2685906 RepID=UPI0014032EEE|nr:hypothetical protein [Marinobacter sp. JSM 1782161]
MSEAALKSLSDMASEAHARIQQAYQTINPVVGVRRGMREMGIPADAMTIDCLRTRRRINLILHDEKPGLLLYQFSTLEEEAGNEFEHMSLTDVTVDTLYDWMRTYFSEDVPDSPTH